MGIHTGHLQAVLGPTAPAIAPCTPCCPPGTSPCALGADMPAGLSSCGGAWRLSGTYSPPCLGAGMNPCGHPTPLRGTVLWVDVCPLLGSEMGGQWGGGGSSVLDPHNPETWTDPSSCSFWVSLLCFLCPLTRVFVITLNHSDDPG